MGLPKTAPSALSLTAKTEGQAEATTIQDRPNSTKKPETIIPAPQRVRIMRKHILGESIRKISREENRARETVTKIVRNDEMRNYVGTLREQFYGLGDDALAAVQHALVEGKDAQIGYRILTDIGAVPSPLERELIQANQEVVKKESLNDWEQALVGDAEGRQAQIMIGLARTVQERARIFGNELPTPQELRHNKAVASLIDELTEGRGTELCHSNPSEWNRLKSGIEEHLQDLVAAEGKSALNRSEKYQLEEKLLQENAEQAAQRQESRLPAKNGENGGTRHAKSRLRLGEMPSSQGTRNLSPET